MLAFLIAASAFAGWIDAVIGGGGLVLIPILMATTGMPAASVLATNKVAAISGTASAAVSLVRRVGVPKFTWIYALIAGIAADWRNCCVKMAVNAMIKNMPVPGPKMPS